MNIPIVSGDIVEDDVHKPRFVRVSIRVKFIKRIFSFYALRRTDTCTYVICTCVCVTLLFVPIEPCCASLHDMIQRCKRDLIVT